MIVKRSKRRTRRTKRSRRVSRRKTKRSRRKTKRSRRKTLRKSRRQKGGWRRELDQGGKALWYNLEKHVASNLSGGQEQQEQQEQQAYDEWMQSKTAADEEQRRAFDKENDRLREEQRRAVWRDTVAGQKLEQDEMNAKIAAEWAAAGNIAADNDSKVYVPSTDKFVSVKEMERVAQAATDADNKRLLDSNGEYKWKTESPWMLVVEEPGRERYFYGNIDTLEIQVEPPKAGVSSSRDMAEDFGTFYEKAGGVKRDNEARTREQQQQENKQKKLRENAARLEQEWEQKLYRERRRQEELANRAAVKEQQRAVAKGRRRRDDAVFSQIYPSGTQMKNASVRRVQGDAWVNPCDTGKEKEQWARVAIMKHDRTGQIHMRMENAKFKLCGRQPIMPQKDGLYSLVHPEVLTTGSLTAKQESVNTSGRSWIWRAMDMSDDNEVGLTAQTLAIRFKNAGIAEDFKDAYEKAQAETTSWSEG
jgi:hypothetical protein